jgi:uncharacterized protein YkwD
MKSITLVSQIAALRLVFELFFPCVPLVRADTTEADAVTVSAAQTQELLNAHNRWRAEVGVPELKWSTAVTEGAQSWANKLATIGVLKHDSSEFGENLSKSPGNQTPTEAVDNWGREKDKCNYNGEAIGDPIGDWPCEVGHYTQVVWRNSTELGCGVAKTANGATFWVCRYNPAGNVTGEKPY